MSRVTAAAEKALTALQAAVESPSTTSNRAAAEAIIRLRRQFKHEGAPDWAGRSPEYRDTIERLYRQAGVPSDSESNMQANLRYHIGNALREAAPREDLMALGMAVEGPLGRMTKQRAENPRPRKARLPTVTTEPLTLAALALSAIEAIGATEDLDPAAMEPALRRVLDTTVDVLTALRAQA